MPQWIQPMLATLVDKPFTDAEWLFEPKWDGYRALAFLSSGRLRLLSRNRNDLTAEFPELQTGAQALRARQTILDGEIVALDDRGRASFSLMQQRTGFREVGRRGRKDRSLPIVYYVFDLLYLDGYSLLRVDLERRKELLRSTRRRGSASSRLPSGPSRRPPAPNPAKPPDSCHAERSGASHTNRCPSEVLRAGMPSG